MLVKNIAEMLRTRVNQSGEKIGIKYLGRAYTWSELLAQAHCLSLKLEKAGVGKGDVVGIYIDHSFAQVAAIFAIAFRDAVFTIINPQLVPDQAKHQIQDASMKAIVGAEKYIAPLGDFFTNRMMVVELIEPEGYSSEELGDSPNIEPKTTTNIPADISNYIYTSGSTGLAKGVVVPHRTLLDGARIVSGYLGIKPEDRILSILPFSFDYGLNQLLSCVYTGAEIVLQQFIFPKEVIDTLEREKITGLAVVPSIWPKILKAGLLDGIALPSLRYVTTAGGFHPPELLEKIAGFLPSTEIIVMYGLTESFRSTYLPFSEMRNRPGSIGRAVPEVEILVLNSEGQMCKPGERGELVHRGAFVTYGYLNNPELNEKKFIHLNKNNKQCLPELAVRSGDEVSLDEDGFIYFHGRIDMQIKSSGYRISPDEVAQAVLSTPGVSHAVVFGMPDEMLGQSIHVAYETYGNKEIDIFEIKRHAKESLAVYAIPHHYHLYEHLPLNANGKIDFNKLKKNITENSSTVNGVR